MSDRFYDNKGIEHYTEDAAKHANESYLREEEKARKEGLELQRQQTEAVERAAREAEWHRREQAEAQEEQLSELKRQGRGAQKDRDYEKNVLFLKESDEGTRLDKFVGILLSILDWKCCPKDEEGCHDEEWTDEHDRVLALFYKLPEVPKECQAGGTLTREILTLVNTPPKSAGAFLPEKALPLKAESDKYDKELHRLDKEISKLARSRSLGCLSICSGVLGGILLAAGVPAVVGGGEMLPALCFCVTGLVMIVSAVLLRRMRHSQSKANQKRMETLEKEKTEIAKKKDVLQRQLVPFWDEARTQARKQVTAKTCAEQWITAYRNALLQSFFDQGLWIEDAFPNRLKEVLKDIQKPFPTSCRADVNNLSGQQIEAVYKVLVATISDLFMFKLDRTSTPPAYNREYPLSRALFPDENLDYSVFKAQEAVFLEKGVYLEAEKYKEHAEQQGRITRGILIAGPSALSTLASNESQHKDDAGGKEHPTIADKSGQKTGASSGMTYVRLPPPIIGDKSGPKPPPLFAVMLVRIPADKKIAVIKVLREVKPSLGLAEALELVENLPSKVLDGVSEAEARVAKERLEQADAGVRIDPMT